MKIISILLLLFSLNAKADDQPLPSNPFSNMPANQEAGFNPFEEDFDAEDNFNGIPNSESNTSRPTAPPAASTSGLSISTPKSANNSSRPSSNSEGRSAVTSPKIEPANAKDIVENFDYPDAEILDVLKAIAKLTGNNFIYNPQDIKGRISVVSATPITVGDAWNAFLTSLNMKGFVIIPSGKYLRIDRVVSAKEKQTPIYANKKAPNNDNFITRVIPLRYIDATEFEQTFRLWIPREARMQAYAQTNTLIITDTAAHINRLVELINLLDIAGYQESLVVIQVKNAPAKDIAKLIEQVLNEGRSGTSNARTYGASRPTTTYQARAATGRSSTGRSGGSVISKIIADDRTNALIVKANAAGIQEIRSLVRRLDTKVAASEGSGRIHVIPLQFANAEELAKTLSTVVGGGNTSRSSNTSSRAFPVFGETRTVFQGDIKVSADKTTQSLVVTATPQDFATLKKVVEKLDIPRDQVFIEALIMEIRLNRDNALGTSFVSASNGISLPGASGALAGLLAGNPLAKGFALGFKKGSQKADVSFGSGDSATTYKVNSLNGLIELIQGNTDANVIATPKITAIDNEQATFEISEQIQVPQTTTTNNVTQRSFQPQKAELSLKVTPQINKASNFVKLDIDQKLENFDSSQVPKDLQGETQGKNTRATNTKVIVQNEDTVVLSGLIRNSITEIVNKVPLLGDIPILGWLFKNSSQEVRKTNLLVFITPTIIKQYASVRKVLNRNLNEREEFVREYVGSDDPMSRRISRLKKELPDLTVIEPIPQKTSKDNESSSFPLPSSSSSDDDEYYDDPNVYYPPEDPTYYLPPANVQQPSFDVEPSENMPAPPVLPEQPQYGE